MEKEIKMNETKVKRESEIAADLEKIKELTKTVKDLEEKVNSGASDNKHEGLTIDIWNKVDRQVEEVKNIIFEYRSDILITIALGNDERSAEVKRAIESMGKFEELARQRGKVQN